jgi:uncharacterized RDD family membrane protein YckC
VTAPEPRQPLDPIGADAGAGVGIRFVARFLDMILLVSVLSLIGIVFGLGTALDGDVGITSIVVNAVWIAVVVGYFAVMESRNGQTFGKMITRLRTIGPDGAAPTLEEAIRRNAWYALGIIPVVGGFAQLGAAVYIAVTISQSALHVGWHDQFAGGTKVLRLG